MIRVRRVIDVGLVCLVLLAGWQILSLTIGERTLTPPLQTAQHIAALLAKPSFMRDLSATGRAYFIALIIAMAGGLALGTLFGGWRAVGAPFEPLLYIIVATPKVTLYPVILLLFGLGDPAKIAFGVLHGLPPVAILVANAIRSLKPTYRRVARTLHLSGRGYAWRILIPAVMPEILDGFRMCFAQTLLGVLVGEMFASSHGLGHLLMASIGVDDMPTTLSIVVLVFVFAGIGNAALSAFRRSNP